MSSNTISDIPSLQELKEDIQTFDQFKSRFSNIEPLLLILNINTQNIENAFQEFEDIKKNGEIILGLPDKFNYYFVEYGWVCYDRINAEVAKSAIELAESGDLEAAEKELANYYDDETIRHQITWLKEIDPFLEKKDPFDHDGGEVEYRETQSRLDLTLKALEDYNEERYHACIPVVLALLDGLAQQVYVDVYGESRSLTAEEANHEAWDSIAGHSTGLEQLKNEILKKGRQKTRTEEIELPYRNGIMHGMDINYDNKLVAAKTWNLLFAVGEWARKARQDEPTVAEKDSDPTLEEALEPNEEKQKAEKRMDEWGPRIIGIGQDIPVDGDPEEYDKGTPERALVELLSKWKVENYGHMANYFRGSDGGAEDPRLVSYQFDNIRLESFNLIDVIDDAPAATDITVEIHIERFGNEETEEKEVRLVRQADDGSPKIWGEGGGEWAIPMMEDLL
ncbi:hypothetical protein [Haladaptatus sp. NG-SE-30]